MRTPVKVEYRSPEQIQAGDEILFNGDWVVVEEATTNLSRVMDIIDMVRSDDDDLVDVTMPDDAFDDDGLVGTMMVIVIDHGDHTHRAPLIMGGDELAPSRMAFDDERFVKTVEYRPSDVRVGDQVVALGGRQNVIALARNADQLLVILKDWEREDKDFTFEVAGLGDSIGSEEKIPALMFMRDCKGARSFVPLDMTPMVSVIV